VFEPPSAIIRLGAGVPCVFDHVVFSGPYGQNATRETGASTPAPHRCIRRDRAEVKRRRKDSVKRRRPGSWGALIRSSCKSTGLGTRLSLCTSRVGAENLVSPANGVSESAFRLLAPHSVAIRVYRPHATPADQPVDADQPEGREVRPGLCRPGIRGRVSALRRCSCRGRRCRESRRVRASTPARRGSRHA
jgi:hypothetical protein